MSGCGKKERIPLNIMKRHFKLICTQLKAHQLKFFFFCIFFLLLTAVHIVEDSFFYYLHWKWFHSPYVTICCCCCCLSMINFKWLNVGWVKKVLLFIAHTCNWKAFKCRFFHFSAGNWSKSWNFCGCLDKKKKKKRQVL